MHHGDPARGNPAGKARPVLEDLTGWDAEAAAGPQRQEDILEKGIEGRGGHLGHATVMVQCHGGRLPGRPVLQALAPPQNGARSARGSGGEEDINGIVPGQGCPGRVWRVVGMHRQVGDPPGGLQVERCLIAVVDQAAGRDHVEHGLDPLERQAPRNGHEDRAGTQCGHQGHHQLQAIPAVDGHPGAGGHPVADQQAGQARACPVQFAPGQLGVRRDQGGPVAVAVHLLGKVITQKGRREGLSLRGFRPAILTPSDVLGLICAHVGPPSIRLSLGPGGPLNVLGLKRAGTRGDGDHRLARFGRWPTLDLALHFTLFPPLTPRHTGTDPVNS